MPLSEEELRLLEQMERALVEEDPKFASTLRGTSLRSIARRRAIIAGVVFVIGVAVMMTGVVAQLIPVGIVGFLIMLGLGHHRPDRAARSAGRRPAPAPTSDAATVSPCSRAVAASAVPRQQRQRTTAPSWSAWKQRWRRRREGGGFH